MLNLPKATVVNRRITKERIYANASLTTQVKDLIKAQVDIIMWRNKLASSTISVAPGENVTEIQVFELAIRQKNLDRRVLSAIAKAIPYKIIFVLKFNNQLQAWAEVSGTFYSTSWFDYEKLSLRIEGLNLDEVYDNLVRQIAGGRLVNNLEIKVAVERDKRKQKLIREISALEKKVFREKQFNKQVAFNKELKRLRKELEEFSSEKRENEI